MIIDAAAPASGAFTETTHATNPQFKALLPDYSITLVLPLSTFSFGKFPGAATLAGPQGVSSTRELETKGAGADAS